MFIQTTLVEVVVAAFIAACLSNFISLLNNIWTAKASGLHYVVVPYYIYNFLTARLLSRTLLKIFNALIPNPSIASWQRLVLGLWPLKLRHAPFAALKTDTFLTVAPGGIIVYTADADVIAQIIARPSDFPKATKLYKSISIYGKNVVSADGAMWRRHRKLTSAAFSERNNQLVWKATIDRSQAMLLNWVRPENCNHTILEVREDIMRLSLEVIGEAALGQNLDLGDDGRGLAANIPKGHTMTFTSSLQYVCLHIVTVASVLQLFPRWFLRNSTWKTGRNSLEAFEDWGRYMQEMIAAKKEAVGLESTDSTSRDIITQLIKGQEEQGNSMESAPLSDSEVMGNLFLFIQAGLETSASSIYFCILMLALHPSSQKAVQSELDLIFAKQESPTEWEFEHSLPQLLNGKLGATMNEQLRLLAPVLTIPKVVCQTPQNVMVDGKEVALPANTTIRLCTPAVHVNPKFWPSGVTNDPPKPDFELKSGIEEFKPERWMNQGTNKDRSLTSEDEKLITPPKGAYLPFSDGQRICLGRRFAQVEVLAALAVIFSKYSVELDVKDFAAEVEVAKMSDREKSIIWNKAEARAQWTWRNKLTSVITVQLTGDAYIPLKIVKRGEERFFHL